MLTSIWALLCACRYIELRRVKQIVGGGGRFSFIQVNYSSYLLLLLFSLVFCVPDHLRELLLLLLVLAFVVPSRLISSTDEHQRNFPLPLLHCCLVKKWRRFQVHHCYLVKKQICQTSKIITNYLEWGLGLWGLKK